LKMLGVDCQIHALGGGCQIRRERTLNSRRVTCCDSVKRQDKNRSNVTICPVRVVENGQWYNTDAALAESMTRRLCGGSVILRGDHKL